MKKIAAKKSEKFMKKIQALQEGGHFYVCARFLAWKTTFFLISLVHDKDGDSCISSEKGVTFITL